MRAKLFGLFLDFGYVCSKPSTCKALIEYSMKKVLGLDLGVGSIGWSLIALDKDERLVEILGMGCRIVPLCSSGSCVLCIAPWPPAEPLLSHQSLYHDSTHALLWESCLSVA